MAEREFLMQPHKYLSNQRDVAGWYVSDKLRGTRCFWDGGISRGMPLDCVPWAGKSNTRVSTGLWTQCGKVVEESDRWLNQLPCIPLDGIWTKEGEFAIISSPPFESIFSTGLVNGNSITLLGMRKWLNSRPESLLIDYRFLPRFSIFEEELAILNEAVPSEGAIYLLRQRKLPANNPIDTLEHLFEQSENGLVLRAPDSIWEPIQSPSTLIYSKGE